MSGQALAFDGSLIDAVRIALAKNPQLAIAQTQVDAQQGVLLSEQSRFDPVVNMGVSNERVNSPVFQSMQKLGMADLRADRLTYSVGMSQALRSGVLVNPVLSVSRVNDNQGNVSSPSAANVALNITFPLGRGQGESVTTAAERAAASSRDAAAASQRHAAAVAAAQAVSAYWSYLAATKVVEIEQRSTERARILLQDAKRLANLGEVPMAESRPYELKLLARQASVSGAEQARSAARQTLILSMGTGFTDVALTDSFPLIAELSRLDLASFEAMFAQLLKNALGNRADLKSAALRIQAARISLEASHDLEKPRTDVNFAVGYNGLVENRGLLGSFRALGERVPGANISVGLNYSFPAGQRYANGQMQLLSAQVLSAELELQALQLQVQAGLRSQSDAVTNAVRQLGYAESAVKVAGQLFEAQLKKYRLGMSTALDVSLTEDGYTDAQLSMVNIQRSFALGLIGLRLESGTLIEAEAGSTGSLTRQQLMSLPESSGK